MSKRSRQSDSDNSPQNFLLLAIIVAVILFGAYWLNQNGSGSSNNASGQSIPQILNPPASSQYVPLGNAPINLPGDIQGSKPSTPQPTQIQGNSQNNPQNTLKMQPDQLDKLQFTQ